MEDYFAGKMVYIECIRCGNVHYELVGIDDYEDICKECKIRIGRLI